MLGFLALALLQTAPAQAAPAQTAPAGPPQWTIRESTDQATGKKAMTAVIRAADGSGRLLVRCDTAAVPIISIQFLPKPPLPELDVQLVTATFDEAMAINSNWQVVGGGAYTAEAVDVWDMVNRIAKAKTVRLTIVKPDDTVTESTFAGPGDDSKFRQVYAACGFPFETPPVPVNPKPQSR